VILGVGVDLVDIRRLEKMIETHGEKFLSMTYVKSEQEAAATITHDQQRASYFAKRFAAKEAFVKALGCGFREDVTFLDISVDKENSGKPIVLLSSRVRKKVEETFGTTSIKIDLSLTDEYPMAQAFVVISNH
jgi:holo-[acyl-carrier protein] synthase